VCNYNASSHLTSITKVYAWFQVSRNGRYRRHRVTEFFGNINISMNIKLLPILLGLLGLTCYSIYLESSPYIEYKTTAPLIDSELLTTTEHLRLGYKLDNNLYFELGPMSHGEGYEFGWKRTQDRWTFKGKVEGYHNSKNIFNNKVQTEIRYTFD